MSIEHVNIPEDGLHEPKGVSTAAANRVYRSDGGGSGDWSQVDANTLQGTMTNSSAAGQLVETDGLGGFRATAAPASAFGTMNLSDNTTVQALTAASDSTLNTDSDFTPITLAFDFDEIENMTSGSNFLEIETSGLYLVDFWANVSIDTTTTRWALKFSVNDTSFVPRSPRIFTRDDNEFYNISANGIHRFVEGDQLKLYMASDSNVDVLLADLTFRLVLLSE